MDYQELIDLGLNGDSSLKLILKAHIEDIQDNKVGVVSVIYATNNKELAENKIKELNNEKDSEYYYMVYSVPLDTDLTNLEHYPSIAITKEDLL